MECAVCEVRSSMGYCCDCSKLLCEQCGVSCDRCNRMICPDHTHVTPHGRRLCTTCMKERDAKRKQRRQTPVEAEAEESTSFQQLSAITPKPRPRPGEAPEEGEEEEEGRVLGEYVPTPPWKLSLMASSTAAFVALLLLVVPWFTGLMQPLSSIVAALVAVLGIIWAVVGLTREEHFEDRPKCFYGLGMAVLALVLAGAAATVHPGGGDVDLLPGQERLDMSPRELEQLRRNVLQKYER